MSRDALNVREAANELGVHENTIRNWEQAGVLRGFKLPGSGFRRFPREEIKRMRDEMMSQYAPDTVQDEAHSNVRGRTIEGDIL